jgi:hypothetical protein
MAFITAALIGGGVSLLGGLLGSNAANKAASTQAAAANNATALQREQWLKNLELQQPFYDAGISAQNALLQYLGLGGDPNAPNYGAGMKPFDPNSVYEDPGYTFRLNEGLKALDRKAAAGGGLLSGGAIKAGQRYAQDYATGEYTNAYNRYWNERNQMLAPLQSMLGQGQTTANQLGVAGQNYATNAGNTMQAAANARASGYMGSANALNSALTGIGNNYMMYSMMNNQPQTSSLMTNYAAAGYPLPPTRPY